MRNFVPSGSPSLLGVRRRETLRTKVTCARNQITRATNPLSYPAEPFPRANPWANHEIVSSLWYYYSSTTQPPLPLSNLNDLLLTMVPLSFPGITYFTSFPLSTRTYQVVDAVVDALTSHSPRDRYLLGYDAQFFFAPITWLPTVVADFILRCLVLRLPAPLRST